MRVVFAGTPAFAVSTLRAIPQAGHELVAVVAQPDRPAGRGHHLMTPATVTVARELGVPVFQPRALRSGPFPERWALFGADVAVVVAYGRILPLQMLSAPRLGCVNVHASLLPRYRGAAPIQWAVARGETVTGVTTMRMSEGLDEGPILLRRELSIGDEENAEALAVRLSEAGAQLLVETLASLETIEPREQEHSLATFAPPLRKEHGRVDWSCSAREIDAIVRGMTPWPGAWATFRECSVRILRTRCPGEHLPLMESEPGTILDSQKRLLVSTGSGVIELVDIQLSCRKAQSARDMVCGMHIRSGERFQ